MNAIAKKDYRWLCLLSSGYNMLVQFPLNDLDKEEFIEALDAGLARPVAIKNITMAMDKQYWMDTTPAPIAKEIAYGYTMLFKNPAVWHETVTDQQILAWYAEERKKFPVDQVKVSGNQYQILEKTDGKLYIKLSKKCESCGLEIKGTCAVSRKPDGSPGNVQMFVPDPQFSGAMPAKPKSKLWLCAEHAVKSVTDDVKEQYKPSSILPTAKRTSKAVVTQDEYADLKSHVKELVGTIKALKAEIKGLNADMKDSVPIPELEARFWDFVGTIPAEQLNGIALFIKTLRNE